MRAKPFSNAGGYSIMQLVVTLAVAMVVTGFAIVGISRAREHFRLTNSAREFASYVERARADAVRRHNTATVQAISEGRYTVTMDFDGDGSVTASETKTFGLQSGVRFTTGIKGVTFDWRGRIPSEQSFGFSNGRNTVSVGVTGSGDVTFDAQFFHDGSLPPVTFLGTGGGMIPDPGASPLPMPSPTPTPTPTPTPDPNASPTPTPDPNASPTPTPYATPTPTPYATPTPTPTGPCLVNSSPDSTLNVVSNGSGTVSVFLTNSSGWATITATSSNTGQIQVSPASWNVNGQSSATFTVTVKRQNGTVTFAATGCSSKTVNVNPQ